MDKQLFKLLALDHERHCSQTLSDIVLQWTCVCISSEFSLIFKKIIIKVAVRLWATCQLVLSAS